jgi:hypothetical protein
LFSLKIREQLGPACGHWIATCRDRRLSRRLVTGETCAFVPSNDFTLEL